MVCFRERIKEDTIGEILPKGFMSQIEHKKSLTEGKFDPPGIMAFVHLHRSYGLKRGTSGTKAIGFVVMSEGEYLWFSEGKLLFVEVKDIGRVVFNVI